jgi:hypothetical protein
LVVHFEFDWLEQSDGANGLLAHTAGLFFIYLRGLNFDLLSAVGVCIIFFW